MWRKQLTIGVLVSFCTFVAHATAQRNELSGAQKNELSVLVGRQFISDQIIPTSTSSDHLLRFGNGLSFEGSIARRVIDGQLLALSLEVPFVFSPDEDLHAPAPTSVPESYNSYFVTPAARLNLFAHTAVSPWVSVGGGFGHFSQSSNFLFGGKNTRETGTTTGVFQIGGGLDVTLYRKFSLRGELRDFWSGIPKLNVSTNQSRQHNLFVGGGVVWHF
jgi:hypothetical protein